MPAPVSPADVLNRDCDCSVADLSGLQRGLETALSETHANLFSDAPVFVDRRHTDDMRELVAVVSRVAGSTGFVESVLPDAPAIARLPQPTAGVFLGFDFHVTPEGPRLIEINTNAGGAMLNVFARGLMTDCCAGVAGVKPGVPEPAQIEAAIVGMFRAEWRLRRGDSPLRTIAIVDDDPAAQFLHPEFLLFQRLFERHGFESRIVDPSGLLFTSNGLEVDRRPIDLVYSRLTDFYLEDPRHGSLREAYLAGAVVMTPHPRAHALLASKRVLALLTDPAYLRSIGTDARDVDTLVRMIPRTLLVDGDEATWWARRKQWFFKPLNGYGGRGAYRGDKITRRAFAEVARGGYVAQEIAPPGERLRTGREQRELYKVDIRAYVYESDVQLFAARLYQGQTTNFRTAGGGFAPVFELEAGVSPGELQEGCGRLPRG
jgi:hypothetical protein